MTEPDFIVNVVGLPQPGGSKRVVRAGAFARVADANPKSAMWKQFVAAAAYEEFQKPQYNDHRYALGTSPLIVACTFKMQRPKSHYKKNGEIKAPCLWENHTKKPDATKLWRSTEDALTGVIWNDDAAIIEQKICKRYIAPGEAVGCEIAVWVVRETVEPGGVKHGDE